MKETIALGADHGGFLIKEEIKKYLLKNNYKVIDCGTDNDTVSVDYPIFAEKVSKALLKEDAQFGILCCGTGIGMSIAANKFNGIRAAVCENEFCCEMTRRHNNSNILCLGGRVISKDTALKLADIFLNTPFDGGRHQTRLDMVKTFESQN